MNKRIFTKSNSRRTKCEKLINILKDGRWHSTRELARRVGHTFGVAKWKLVHELHYDIEARRHPTKYPQWQYQLVPPPKG